MKTFIATLLLVLGLATISSAAPFATCAAYKSPQIIPTFCEIGLDGGTLATCPVALTTDGTGTVCKCDLAGTTPAAHSLVMYACNVWGCSPGSVPFSFTSGIPATPATILLLGTM